MKIYLFFALFTTITISSLAQTDTTLQKLVLINYTAYKGHKVDSLIKVLPTNYTKMIVLPSHRGEYGDVLAISYPNDVSVWIQVKQFKFMNPHLDFSKPLKGQWKVNLLKKETMAFAIVYKANACWVGCENDPKTNTIIN